MCRESNRLKRPTKISFIDPYSKPDRNDPGSESIQKRTVTNDIGQNGDNKNPSTVSEQAWLSPIQVLTVRPKGNHRYQVLCDLLHELHCFYFFQCSIEPLIQQFI